MGRLAVLFLTGTGLLLAQPQARTIVYSRVGPSQIQLFVSNADGTAERPFLRRKVNGEVWLPLSAIRAAREWVCSSRSDAAGRQSFPAIASTRSIHSRVSAGRSDQDAQRLDSLFRAVMRAAP
jgi:hypothetical protein